MQVISLASLLAASSNRGEDVYEYLTSFSCSINPDVESYLHNKAIESEIRDYARTNLVIDEENNNEIVGYFTILIKPFEFKDSVSKSVKQRLTGNKNAPSFLTILIAQIGRSDQYKGIVSGSLILNLALEKCFLIKELVALKVVCVEYFYSQNLQSFYEYNGFKVLQHNENGCIISFLKI